MDVSLSYVEDAIDAAQYGEALDIILRKHPTFGSFSAGATLPVKRRELYVALKLFNRMQWLCEAALLADELSRISNSGTINLNRDELIELALTKLVLGQPAAARVFFNQALKQFGKDALLLSEIAFTYAQQGVSDKAEQILERLARDYTRKGGLDDVGLRVFNRLINIRQLKRFEKNYIEKLFKKNRSPHQYARLAHILAIAARYNKETDREIDLLQMANEQSKQEGNRAGNIWSQVQAEEKLQLIKQLFSQRMPNWLQAVEPSSEKIIFVLGMPRSGTTLLEQIIGAHSLVGNSGESMALDVALRKGLLTLGGLVERGNDRALRNLPHMSTETLAYIHRAYLSYQSLLSSAEVLTDKQLAAVDFVGLLQAFFINAKFIFIERDPLDNCVSLMQRDFHRAPYSNDPVHIIQEGASYLARMEYWMELYPEKFYRVSYERLVSDPNTQIEKLIEACGLDWQPQIMRFHLRDNSVRTPSAGQVRNEINTAAVEKWKRYTRLIKPAINYLDKHQLF